METIGEILKWIGGLSVCLLLWFCVLLAWFAWQERKERKSAAQIDAMSMDIQDESPATTTPEPECQSAAPEATTPRVTAPASPFVNQIQTH